MNKKIFKSLLMLFWIAVSMLFGMALERSNNTKSLTEELEHFSETRKKIQDIVRLGDDGERTKNLVQILENQSMISGNQYLILKASDECTCGVKADEMYILGIRKIFIQKMDGSVAHIPTGIYQINRDKSTSSITCPDK